MTAEPVTASVHVAADPGVVFEYFTRPEAMVRWIGEYAVLDPSPGGEFTLDIGGVAVRGQYLEIDPPHRLVISWGTRDPSYCRQARARWRSVLSSTPEARQSRSFTVAFPSRRPSSTGMGGAISSLDLQS